MARVRYESAKNADSMIVSLVCVVVAVWSRLRLFRLIYEMWFCPFAGCPCDRCPRGLPYSLYIFRTDCIYVNLYVYRIILYIHIIRISIRIHIFMMIIFTLCNFILLDMSHIYIYTYIVPLQLPFSETMSHGTIRGNVFVRGHLYDNLHPMR